MILVNIDSLSMTELRYLAKQEGIEDVEIKDKDDLLDELSDIFDIFDGSIQLDGDKLSSSNQRYVNALSDFPGHEKVDDLPGVEDLEEVYMETSMHLMLRDFNWAFAYWSIAPLTYTKLMEEDESYLQNLFLRVTSTNDETGESSIYDIKVDKEDTSWSINLFEFGHTYQVALCCKSDAGMLIALAQSLAVKVPLPYWYVHFNELEEDPVLFNSLFSSIITKGGNYRDNIVVPKVVNKLQGRRMK